MSETKFHTHTKQQANYISVFCNICVSLPYIMSRGCLTLQQHDRWDICRMQQEVVMQHSK